VTALLLILLFLLIALNGVFVSAEFALVRSRRSRIEQLAAEGARGASAALEQIDRIDEYLSACQLGITMASIGIGFLGEPGKVAAAGKKRITDWSDDGTLTVSVAFAAGEKSVTIAGYAASAPVASADSGAVGAVQYDGAKKQFSVSVMPTGMSAIVKLHL